MGFNTIIRLAAVLFAVVAGLVDIAYAATIIAILGLVAGYFVDRERRGEFLISTLALNVVPGVLTAIPGVGIYLTDVLVSLSGLFNAAACTVIVVAIAERLKP